MGFGCGGRGGGGGGACCGRAIGHLVILVPFPYGLGPKAGVYNYQVNISRD